MRKYFRYGVIIVIGNILLLWFFCLPRNLFEGVSYSTVVTDRNGELLGARVADDGQWRFPPSETLPEKFVKALIEFEDHRFYAHCGVSARGIVRAIVQNLRNGRIVSGGSTLSMQVIRLSRQKPRTIWQKVVEMFMATRLEARYTKEEILRIYASHAPFGGNVVGIDAALWRYLGDSGADLSWAEAATLAVLQNAPSLIHLNKNRNALLGKRNRLLSRLHEKGELSDDDYCLAIEEPLIGEPYPMPQYTPHLVEYYNKTAHGKHTTVHIDIALQERVEELATRWCQELRLQNIRDLAVVMVEVESGEIVAYCGNSDMSFEREGKWVDIARANRSSGSILKPLLYTVALQEGIILPETLLPDVPTDFRGFTPKNFDGTYAGAIAADEALALSLNIPNVHLLKAYGVARFAETLQRAGFVSLNRSTDKYGLSLVLGGAEVCLCDVVSCYARMAACYIDTTAYAEFPLRDRVALYHTFNAMREVNRPDQMDWRRATSVQNVAWKTGTSYGSRDAWAIGVTPQYVVGVWVGNADGSGVAELTGARIAGPILFDMLNLLSYSEWFAEPCSTDGVTLKVCVHSGHLAGRYCTDTKEVLLPRNSVKSLSCPYCKEFNVSLDGLRLITDRSEPTRAERYFVLPPLMEHYYKQQHQEYIPLPTKILTNDVAGSAFHFVYPSDGSIVSVSKQMDGMRGSVVCQVVHSLSTQLFWHLADSFIGTTSNVHKMQIQPSLGYHTITVVDGFGSLQTISIIVK